MEILLQPQLQLQSNPWLSYQFTRCWLAAGFTNHLQEICRGLYFGQPAAVVVPASSRKYQWWDNTAIIARANEAYTFEKKHCLPDISLITSLVSKLARVLLLPTQWQANVRRLNPF